MASPHFSLWYLLYTNEFAYSSVPRSPNPCGFSSPHPQIKIHLRYGRYILIGGEGGIADFVLFHSAVLGASSCARLRYTEPVVRVAHLFGAVSAITNQNAYPWQIDILIGGEGGIRTRGRAAPTHAFQACSLSHSDTSPYTVSSKSAQAQL